MKLKIKSILIAALFVTACLLLLQHSAYAKPDTPGENNSGMYEGGTSHTHNYVTVTVQSATCTNWGVSQQKCSGCGHVSSTGRIPPLGHSAGSGPTCTSPQKCTRCGSTLQRALGHNWGGWYISVNETCTSDGQNKNVCRRCGATQTSVRPALGHSWSGWQNNGGWDSGFHGSHWKYCYRCNATTGNGQHDDDSPYDGYCDTCGKYLYDIATVPSKSDYTYNGVSQRGLPSGTGYTVSGTQDATNANADRYGNVLSGFSAYSVSASLKSGYRWSDKSWGTKSYSWVIKQKQLIVQANNKEKVYGETNPAWTVSFSGQVSGQTPKISGGMVCYESGTTLLNNWSPAGTYVIRDYNIALVNNGSFIVTNYYKDYRNGTMTISKRPVIVKAKEQTITFGSDIVRTTDMASIERTSATLSGKLAGHYISAVSYTPSTLQYTTNGTITPSGVTISNSSGANVTANYSITYSTGKLVVNKWKLHIIWDPIVLTYNGKVQTPTASIDTSSQYAPRYNEVVRLSVSGGSQDAGYYANKASVSIASITNSSKGFNNANNYEIMNPKSDYEIKPKDLNVYPTNNFSKIYQDPDPQIIPSFYWGNNQTDLQNGETPGYTGHLERVAGENVGRYNIIDIGTFKIANNGSFKVNNYNLIFNKYRYNTTELAYFTINPRDIAPGTITLNPTEFDYDRTEKKPHITLVVNNTTLVESDNRDKDFYAVYYDNVDAGIATIELFGVNNYKGTKVTTFRINGADIGEDPISKDFTIEPVPREFIYDGSPKTPGAIVKYKGTVLSRGTDYTLSWRNNVNAGKDTAIIVVRGQGNFKGTKEATFTINPRLIEGRGILDIDSYEYDGKAKVPRVVKFTHTSGVELVLGTDYELSYVDNVEVGTGKVIVKGINNYYGEVEILFEIFEATPTITLKDKMAVYSGQPIYIDEAQVHKLFNYREDSEDYTGIISLDYKYYKDINLTEPISGGPVEIGSYYVQATLPADDNHFEVKSNIAKLVIYGQPTPPLIEGNDGVRIIPNGGRVSEGIYINVFGTEVDMPKEVLVKYKYSLDQNTWFDYSETLRYTDERTITVYAYSYIFDNPTLKSDVSSYEVTIDRTTPVEGNITVPEIADSVVIDVSVDNDEIDYLFITEDENETPTLDSNWQKVRNDENPTEAGKTIFELSQGDGEKQLYVWQMDEAGNVVRPSSPVTVRLRAKKIGNGNDNKTTFYFKTHDEFLHTSDIEADDIELFVNEFPTEGSVTSLTSEKGEKVHNFTGIIEGVTGEGYLSFKVNKELIFDKAGNNIYDANQEVQTREVRSGDREVQTYEIEVDNTTPVLRVNVEKNKAYVFVDDLHVKAVMQNGRIIGRKNGEFVVDLEKGNNVFTAYDEFGNDITIVKDYDEVFEVHTSIANEPRLLDNMQAVYFTGNNKNTSTYFTEEMYEYSHEGTSRWANAQTSDGSMWVWIPRFAYRLSYFTDSSYRTRTNDVTSYYKYEILYLRNRSNEYMDQNGNLCPLPLGYEIPKAFTSDINNGGTNYELLGFWIAKYEMANENGMPVSKEGASAWTNINLSNAYLNGASMYPEYESHLAKNSEFEATYILGISEYGKNGSIDLGTSTTNDVTGVYSITGGKYEYVAAYVDGLNGSSATNIVNSTNNNYKEVMNQEKLNSMFITSHEEALGINATFFNGTKAIYRGVNASNSILTVNNGEGNTEIGYRVVLFDDKSTASDNLDSEYNTTTPGGKIIYEPNGGNGRTRTAFARESKDYVIPDNTFFTKVDYKFIGWGLNTTDVTYNPGDVITVSDEIRLYAIWRINLAQYVSGTEFNSRIKALTSNNGASIEQFIWASAEPSDSIKGRAVDVSNTEIPVYAWLEGNTIKLWSDAYAITLNNDSSNMFKDFSSLVRLDVFENLHIRDSINVQNMQSMFEGCTALPNIDLSKFDTRNVTNMSRMFKNNSNIETISIYGLNTGNVTTMESMFESCSRLTGLDLQTFDTAKVTNMSSMFRNCTTLTTLDLIPFDTSRVTTFSHMFDGDYNIVNLEHAINTASATDLSFMFNGCTNVKAINTKGFDTAKVINMESLFNGCNTLAFLDVHSFNTARVTNMKNMFTDCKNVTSLNVSYFNTANVTTMEGMFKNCENLTELSVLNFNTAKVTTMNSMFEGLRKITVLDLASFSSAVLTKTAAMFKNDVLLKKVYVNNEFSVNNVTESQEMFINDTSIVGGAETPYDATKTNKEYARIDGKNGLLGYLWNHDTYTLTYNANGGSLGLVPATVTKTYGEDIYITTNEPVRNGYKFKWWSKGTASTPSGYLSTSNDYLPGVVYKENNDRTLYAVWLSYDSEFVSGKDFNRIIKVAAGNSSATYTSDNTNIKSIRWQETQPSDSIVLAAQNVAKSGKTPIYAWLDGNTIKILSEARNLKLDSDLSYMFSGLKGLTNSNLLDDIHGMSTSHVTNMSYMFKDCIALTNLELGFFDTANVTNMAYMFENVNHLTTINTGVFDTGRVTNMEGMFKGMTALTSLNLSLLKTNAVTNMSHMFDGNENMTSIDVRFFNTANVTNMSYMFNNNKKLASLDLSSFNTNKVTNMAYMFSNLDTPTVLDISKFNTSRVTNMNNMFSNCDRLQRIYVDYTFTVDSVTDSANMFGGSTNLRGGSGTTPYTTDHVDKSYAYIDGRNGPKGYLWCHDVYVISFNQNAGSEVVRDMPSSRDKVYGEPITLSDYIPRRDGYTFKGWSLSSGTGNTVQYNRNTSCNINANTTLYAVWQ